MRSNKYTKSTKRTFAKTYKYSLKFPIFVSSILKKQYCKKMNPHHANNKYIPWFVWSFSFQNMSCLIWR